MAGCFESVVGAQANLTSAQRVAIAVLCCLLLGFLVATVVLAFGSGGDGGGESAHHRGSTTPQPPTITTAQSHPATTPTTPHAAIVNNSAAWKRAAAYLLEGLDESVKPCDDFYKFACNNIIKKVPKNKTVRLDADYIAWLERELVAFAKSNDSQPFPLNMFKNALNNCFNMNIKTEEQIMAVFVNEQMEKYGGFPLKKGTVFNETTFKPFTAMLSTLAMSADLSMAFFLVDGSSKAPRVLHLPGFPFSMADYKLHLKPYIQQKLDNYDNYKQHYLKFYGIALVDNQTFTDELSTVDALMLELSMLDLNETEQTVSLRSLNHFDFGDLYTAVKTNLANKELSDDTLVKLRVGAVKQAVALMRSKKKAMQSYIMMRLADGYVLQFAQLNVEYEKTVNREKSCVHVMFVSAPKFEVVAGIQIVTFQAYWMLATHYLAKKANVTPEVVRFAEQLLGELRGSFGQRLARLDWLSLSDYRKLSRRVRTVTPYVGLPQWLFDLASLSEAYEGFDVPEGGSFMRDTIVRTSSFFFKHMLYGQLVGDRSNNDYWTNTAFGTALTQPNAYYTQLMERKLIVVDFPFLEEPILQSDFPPAVNYGTLGFIMGHEFMHGFDWQSMNESSLALSQTAANRLSSDFDCLEQQYDKISYTLRDVKVFINGSMSLGENIADNGGIGLAYAALLSRMGLSQEERMPGVMEKFDGKQTFFLAMARRWCEHRNDQDLKHQIETDVHPPSRTRITQTLQNFPPFAAAFDCKPGSFMKPKAADRCTVW